MRSYSTSETQFVSIRSQAPCAALQPFVKRFLVVESTVAHGDTHLPDIGLVAAFRFQGECQLENGVQAPRTALTGIWDTARSHFHSQDHTVIIATFSPTGAAALLRQSVDEFTNATHDFSAVLADPNALERLYDQMSTAATHEQRIRLVERLLLAHTDKAQLDAQINAAVALLEQSQPTLRIEQLAHQIGLSQSALERRFRRVVGVAPRQFASLVRLRHVLQLHTTGADLTTIAHAAGYYDQSHFVKDFRHFTGLTPSSFFAPSSTR